MFTGIIQGQGEVLALRDSGTERRFTLRPLFSLPSIVDGESIAVNGACLSVETHGEGVFTAYASTETLSRTTLGRLKTGDSVNMMPVKPAPRCGMADMMRRLGKA